MTLAILVAAPAVAQEGGVAVECVDPARPQDKLTFGLDLSRQTVTGAFPTNWTWFDRGSVLFGYSVSINGRQETLQSYTLDRATGILEICDFAAGGEQACGRHAQCSLTKTQRNTASARRE